MCRGGCRGWRRRRRSRCRGRRSVHAPCGRGRALLGSVARGHDNELFVLLADLLESDEHLTKLLAAVKVALARHHQVMVLCPWPADLPPPRGGRAGHAEPDLLAVLPTATPRPALLSPPLWRFTIERFHQALFTLRP